MKRKFEFCKGYESADLKLPQRATKFSAGYDFYAAETIIIYPIEYPIDCENDKEYIKQKPVLIKTGIKAKMKDNEFLQLCNRSSNPIKKGLMLANGVGIIDSDYYSNENNDGHIMFAFWNLSNEVITVNKGDAIGQGIFQKYYVTDDDTPQDVERAGGFGSTTN